MIITVNSINAQLLTLARKITLENVLMQVQWRIRDAAVNEREEASREVQ